MPCPGRKQREKINKFTERQLDRQTNKPADHTGLHFNIMR